MTWVDKKAESFLVVDKRTNQPPEDEELRLAKGLRVHRVQAGFCLSHSEGREFRELPILNGRLTS